MRKLFLTLTGVFLFFQMMTAGNSPAVNCIIASSTAATGDSLRYLTHKDTVFLKVNEYGTRIYTHKMEKGQTLYSLARFYGLKPDALYSFNPELDINGSFSPGDMVNIPIPVEAIVKSWARAQPKWAFAPVYYEVKHGDTFFRVAKTLFQMPLDTLQRRNKLKKTVLSSGQLLHIGWISTKGIPDSLQQNNVNPLLAKMQELQIRFEETRSSRQPQFQNGAAYWQREKKAGNDYYALHRTAPVGSVIQISNPMKRRKVYAEVIAPIPNRAYGDDIIVVLSPAIANLLGVRDPKFFVEIRYFGKD